MSMSKKDTIYQAAKDALFTPTPAQQRVKAAFYAIQNSAPIFDMEELTDNQIYDITGDKSIHEWWRNIKFRSWFKNEQEYVQKAEYLFTRALDELEDILELGNDIEDPEEKRAMKAKLATSKLNAIKLLFEVTNRMPKNNDKVDELAVKREVMRMLANLDSPAKLKAIAEGNKEG